MSCLRNTLANMNKAGLFKFVRHASNARLRLQQVLKLTNQHDFLILPLKLKESLEKLRLISALIKTELIHLSNSNPIQ